MLFVWLIWLYVTPKCSHAANWQSAYSTFCMGVSAFIALLAVVGWVVFWSHQSKFYSAGIVTLCAIVLLFAWSVLNGKYAHLHYVRYTVFRVDLLWG